MPWSEVTVVNQRTRFVADVERGGFVIRELCRRYGISRPTAYLWLTRYRQERPKGLHDRSHRPHTCPHQTPPAVWGAIREARHHHPSWGPKKLLWLVAKRWTGDLPAPSTVAAWLKREGLVKPRRRSVWRPHPGRPLARATQPNAIWTIDFKGQFRTRDGRYCYPLTIVDGHSRYVLGCQALLHPTRALTRPVLERLFHEYGLPERLRSDNGPRLPAPPSHGSRSSPCGGSSWGSSRSPSSPGLRARAESMSRRLHRAVPPRATPDP